jgi:hypothetical protein
MVPNVYALNGKRMSEVIAEGMPPRGNIDEDIFRTTADTIKNHFIGLLKKNEVKRQRMLANEEKERKEEAEKHYDPDDLSNPEFVMKFDPNFDVSVIKKILEDCKEQCKKTPPLHANASISPTAPSTYPTVALLPGIEPMPVAWQAKQMRTAKPDEQMCENEQKCVVFRHPRHKWIMKSTVFPSESKRKIVPRRKCVACLRDTYSRAYDAIKTAGLQRYIEHMLVPPFFHLCGVEGEYNSNYIVGPDKSSLPVAELYLDRCVTNVEDGVNYLVEPAFMYHDQQVFYGGVPK